MKANEENEVRSAALRNARTIATARRQAERSNRKRYESTAFLATILEELLTVKDTDEIARIFPKVAAHLCVDTYLNYMVNEEGDALSLYASGGVPQDILPGIARLEFGRAICGTVAPTRKPITVTDIQRSDDERAALVRGFGIQAYTCNPMLIGDRLLGTLSFASRTRSRFAPQELECLRTLTQYVAIAIDRLGSEDELRRRVVQAALLAAIVDSTDDGIISKSLSGIITSWNKGAERMFGYTAQEAIGRSITMLIPRDRLDEEPAILERLGRGERVDHFETIRVRKDGSPIEVSLTISPVKDEDGQIVGASKIARDITERKRTEEALRKTNEELDAANRNKADFIAVLCHELRSPLNAVLGWATVLRRGQISENELRKGLDIIIRNSKMQGQLISDMLDAERIATGKLSLELQALDLRQEAETALDAALPAAAEREIRLELEGDPGPVHILGDTARMQQVLGNLLSNAIKFSPGGGRVRVTVRRTLSLAEVSVSDTGQGISAKALPHMFERFRQADSRAKAGLGLGLSISKQLVELQGGTVSARSPGMGKGATFTVSLPLVAGESATHHALLDRGAYPGLAVALRGLKVLVVDDEAEAREPVRRVLEEAGAETVAVRSVDEALEAIKRQEPDIVVSDIGMPGKDGYDFIRAVRAQPPKSGGLIPAIALTAFATTEDRDRALAAGYSTHLAKPIEAAELVAVVAAMVSRRPSGPPGEVPS